MATRDIDDNLTTTMPTKGDAARGAAGGSGGVVDVTSVSIPHPSKWRPGQGTLAFGGLKAYLQPSGGGSVMVLEPPEQPQQAYRWYRLSPLMGSILEAFSVNVYGANYSFEPVIDLDDPDARDQIRSALEALQAGEDLDAEVEVSDQEVATEIQRIRRRMRREKEFLDAWFSNACSERSYHATKILTGQDKGILGTGYWEVIRDATRRPRRVVWVPAHSVRALPQDADWVVMKRPGKVTSLHWHDEEEHFAHFRQYIQLDGSNQVVARYKEYGDPRIMSRGTGRYYSSPEDMEAAEAKTVPDGQGGHYRVLPLPATELLNFPTWYAGSQAYGKPRHSPVGPELTGLRDLSEHNRLVVTDQSIPNMILLVAGAKVNSDVIKDIKDQFKQREPGDPQIVVVQAFDARNAPSGPTITPTMKLEKTKDSQNTDGLGLNYTKQGWKAIRQNYRMPKVAIGDDDQTNRATAYIMYRYTEDQVYDPERCDFDDRINTTLVIDLGIRYHKYKTLTRAPKDPELISTMIERLAKVGVISPDEGRELAEQIFNRKFKDIDAVWTKLPVVILNAILQTKNKVTGAAVLMGEKPENEGDIGFMELLRDSMLKEFELAGLAVGAKKKPEAAAAGDGSPPPAAPDEGVV
uniref:Putative portal protein n=1 Tax=viral metagenome TaxID=1070528 RepID=A0A6H1Z8X5_9ZZZZ